MNTIPSKTHQPPLRAVPMSLFPTANTLQEVVDQAETKLPISSKNELIGILMLYHNTLLYELNKGH